MNMEYQGNERITMLEQELDSIKVAFNDALDEIDLLNTDLEQANEDLLDEKYHHEVTLYAFRQFVMLALGQDNPTISMRDIDDFIKNRREDAMIALNQTSTNEVQE